MHNVVSVLFIGGKSDGLCIPLSELIKFNSKFATNKVLDTIDFGGDVYTRHQITIRKDIADIANITNNEKTECYEIYTSPPELTLAEIMKLLIIGYKSKVNK